MKEKRSPFSLWKSVATILKSGEQRFAAGFFLSALRRFPVLFLRRQAWVVCSWSHSFSLTLFEVSRCNELIPTESSSDHRVGQ